MAHACRSSLFQHRLESAIDSIADSVVRYTVLELPLKVRLWKNANAHKLGICNSDLSEESVEMILSVLNDDWSVPLRERSGKLNHYCPPGCCASDKVCQMKTREALKATVGKFFDVPLLYRWKHFDPAVQFTLRNLLIHQVLMVVWEATMNKVFDEGAIDLASFVDADSADLAPAMKQKIRMGKVWQMLSEDGILVTWLGPGMVVREGLFSRSLTFLFEVLACATTN